MGGGDPRPRADPSPAVMVSSLPLFPPSPLPSSHSFLSGLGVSPPPTFSLLQLHGVVCGRPIGKGAGPTAAIPAGSPAELPSWLDLGPDCRGCGDSCICVSPSAPQASRHPLEGPWRVGWSPCRAEGPFEALQRVSGTAAAACAGRRQRPRGPPSSVAVLHPEGLGGFTFLPPAHPSLSGFED